MSKVPKHTTIVCKKKKKTGARAQFSGRVQVFDLVPDTLAFCAGALWARHTQCHSRPQSPIKILGEHHASRPLDGCDFFFFFFF